MTDEELLLWLRVEDTNLTDFAADRIEALLNLNEALVELMDDRDAKLAKAVEAITQIAEQTDGVTPEPENLQMAIGSINAFARATLAVLKGENQDGQ